MTAPVLVEKITSPYTGKMKMKTRPVAAFDGEGITLGEKHRYTLLTALQGWGSCETYSVRNWRRGLSTEQCLTFLLSLPWAGWYKPVNVSYSFGYDVTMICADLSEEEKRALHVSGWVVWQSPKSRLFYLEYAPKHWFFCGEIGPEEARYTRMPTSDVYDWAKKHPGKKWIRIDDAFGFAQVSFVRMLEEHKLCSPEMLAYIATEKAARSEFNAADRKEIERYNIAECGLLIRYIKMLQAMCLSQDMRLPGWYGPGALASVLLQKNHSNEYVADPENDDMRRFVMRAASGGRIEEFKIGLIPTVYNGDIGSAYPHKTTMLPNLQKGIWGWADAYTADPYSLWEVDWKIPAHPSNLMPFPYRDSYGRIWYPSSGLAVVHQCELQRALMRYTNCIRIRRGLVFTPSRTDGPDAFPFMWLHEIAALRLDYKAHGDGRHIPLKLGMNSIPGKFWQHQIQENTTPPYQSFYAAGFVTAQTRAQVWDYIYSGGADASDVALIATDGVYSLEPRPAVVRGNQLGDWENEKIWHDFLLIRAGIYTANPNCNALPLRRTRGFGRVHLDYARAASIWQESCAGGDYCYDEKRFIGLGSCAGRGNYQEYATWVTQTRHLSYAPQKGIANPTDDGIILLTPPAFSRDAPGLPYNPRPPQDNAPAFALWQELQMQRAETGDQP